MRTLICACLCLGLAAVSARAAEEVITPRYHAALGVKLHQTEDMFAGYFACEHPGGETGKYRFDASIKGALVSYAMQGYPAYEAGLACGDIITAVDDVKIPSPGALPKYIFARAIGAKVTLTVMKAKPVQQDARGYILVEHKPKKLKLSLRAQDWLVTLRSTILPDSSGFERKDGSGPAYSLKYTTRYDESNWRPSSVSYTCEVWLDGEVERLSIKSPYLELLGADASTYELLRGGRQLIRTSGAIGKEGIPVLTQVPITYRARVWEEKPAKGSKAVPERDPTDGLWYVEEHAFLECWLPEKRAWEIAAREKAARAQK